MGTLWIAKQKRRDRDIIYIYDIRINLRHQGRGYGTEALCALEDLSRSLGVAGIGLHVFGHNAAAQALIKNWPGAPDGKIVGEQVRITMKYIVTPPGHPAGWIDEKTVADALQLLQSTGEIPEPKPVSAFYTNALLGQ